MPSPPLLSHGQLAGCMEVAGLHEAFAKVMGAHAHTQPLQVAWPNQYIVLVNIKWEV